MKPYGWLGLGLLILSEIFLFGKIEPFRTWFYSFAWWSYILLADNLLLRLRGRSLIRGRSSELRLMLPFSVFIWLLFEAYNLLLRNWAYAGLPANPIARRLGYAAAFATVLPGIFLTCDLIEHFLFGPGPSPAASEAAAADPEPGRPYPRVLFLIGLCLSLAPLLWPRYLFPAVWVGPILLLDPLLERFGKQSLYSQWRRGARRRIASLLLGGLACGVLWEFWNFWAASRWIYTLPLFANWKVFEMPVLGFLGFPPFALECWLLYHILAETHRRIRSLPLRAAFWAGIGLYAFLMFLAIDRRTVIRLASILSRSAPA